MDDGAPNACVVRERRGAFKKTVHHFPSFIGAWLHNLFGFLAALLDYFCKICFFHAHLQFCMGIFYFFLLSFLTDPCVAGNRLFVFSFLVVQCFSQCRFFSHLSAENRSRKKQHSVRTSSAG